MVVGEVLSETALPRMVGDDVLGRAYGLALPVSLSGIVVGSLVAGPLVSVFGLQGALIGAGVAVAVIGALLLRQRFTAASAEHQHPPLAPVLAVGHEQA